MAEDDFDSGFDEKQHSRVLAKEEKNYEKLKERIEQTTRGTAEFIKAALKDEATRQNLAKEGLRATNRFNSGEDTGLRARINRYNQYGGVFSDNAEEIISGMEERPWERE